MPIILTRQPGESVCIGHDIKIRFLSRKGKEVRLLIEVPKNMRVERKEKLLENEADKKLENPAQNN